MEITNTAKGGVYENSCNESNETIIQLVSDGDFTIEKYQNGTKETIMGYVGMTVTYKITITNNNSYSAPFYFTDVLDTKLSYVSNSFKVNGVLATPTFANNTLSYEIDSISPCGGYAYVEFDTVIV